MYSLGIDCGSSGIKVTLLDIERGTAVARALAPQTEMAIISLRSGWAEQDPLVWWNYFLEALSKALSVSAVKAEEIACIGISYQMHGLVLVDQKGEPLRNSIIWCDSRAVPYGEKALKALGSDFCEKHLLNSPGNFTAAKMAWVIENEPYISEKAKWMMLPGDFMVLKMTGNASTTTGGLSEAVMYDFTSQALSREVTNFFEIPVEKIPEVVPQIGLQDRTNESFEKLTGIKKGTPVTYRAGDQPNNAFSLNVLNPSEFAATAGTSGVLYSVTDKLAGDSESRVNVFSHVNSTKQDPRNGILLCVNGCGILYSWIRKNIAKGMSYDDMNHLASLVPAGSNGLQIYPFGNGAERLLGNKETHATIKGLEFNRHDQSHLLRASQEGIVHSMRLGKEIMDGLGTPLSVCRVGNANLFLSSLFTNLFSNSLNTVVEIYETDGAEGAARGAILGAGLRNSFSEVFEGLRLKEIIEPDTQQVKLYDEIYSHWKEQLTLS